LLKYLKVGFIDEEEETERAEGSLVSSKEVALKLQEML